MIGWLIGLIAGAYGIKELITFFGHGGCGTLIFALFLGFISLISFAMGTASINGK